MDRLLSTKEVAEMLQVPANTIHQWLHVGTAPRSLKIGRHRRWILSDVERWAEARADRPAVPDGS